MKKLITRSKFIALLLCASLFLVSYDLYTNAGGAPTNRTSAPSESNCTVTCHTGTLITSGAAWSSITLSGIPAGGYVPGASYSLTLSGASAATVRNGFQLTVLNSSNIATGTLTAGTGTSKVTSTREYINQSDPSLSSWTFTWLAPATGTGTVTFYINFNGSNNNFSDGSGDNIYAKSFPYSEQASNLPSATITASPTNSVCVGDTLTLVGGGINTPTGFAWTISGGTFTYVAGFSASTQTTKIIITQPSFYTISLVTSNINGNSSPKTLIPQIVGVIKPTSATITASNPYICGSDSVTLTANVVSGASYLWSPGNINGRVIKVGNAGSYTVKISNVSGCSITSSPTVITKKDKPVVDLTSNKDTICTSDSVKLMANGKASRYNFYNGITLLKSGKDSVFYFSAGQGVYNISVVAQDSIFCTTTSITKTITVVKPLPAPLVSCGNKTLTSVEFNWPSIPGAIKYEISTDTSAVKNWFSPNGIGSLSHNITGLPINGVAKVWVRAADNSICGIGPASSLTCQAANCSRLPVKITATNKACANDTGKVNIGVSIANNGGLYFVIIDNKVSFGSGNYVIKLGNKLGATNIAIRVIDSLIPNCPFDTTIQVTNYDNPTGVVEIISKKQGNIYCHYDTVIDIKTRMLTGADSIIFSKLNLITFNETPLKSTSNDTSYIGKTSAFAIGNNAISVRIKNNFSGCEKRNFIQLKRVEKIGAAYNITPGSPAGNIVFSDITTTPTIKRVWSFGDNKQDTAKSIAHQYTSNGTFISSLILQEINSCYDTALQTITISKVGIKELNNSTLKLYPIPAQNIIHVQLAQHIKMGYYTIIDMLGKTILEGNISQNNFDIAVQDLAKGQYIISIKADDELMQKKMLIE